MLSNLPRSFYSRSTSLVAKNLLGKILIRKLNNVLLSGIITETEAYGQNDDPASHAYSRITQRNHAMFEEVGHVYVYLTYGIHYCVNIVAKNNNVTAGAVLLRSLKPISGIQTMMKNRKTNTLLNLTNGPGKITQALKIDKQQYGHDLIKSNYLYITLKGYS